MEASVPPTMYGWVLVAAADGMSVTAPASMAAAAVSTPRRRDLFGIGESPLAGGRERSG
ncbi:hypothetical protein GCM10027199_68900 [Amycolatopsis magusensis]